MGKFLQSGLHGLAQAATHLKLLSRSDWRAQQDLRPQPSVTQGPLTLLSSFTGDSIQPDLLPYTRSRAHRSRAPAGVAAWSVPPSPAHSLHSQPPFLPRGPGPNFPARLEQFVGPKSPTTVAPLSRTHAHPPALGLTSACPRAARRHCPYPPVDNNLPYPGPRTILSPPEPPPVSQAEPGAAPAPPRPQHGARTARDSGARREGALCADWLPSAAGECRREPTGGACPALTARAGAAVPAMAAGSARGLRRRSA